MQCQTYLPDVSFKQVFHRVKWTKPCDSSDKVNTCDSSTKGSSTRKLFLFYVNRPSTYHFLHLVFAEFHFLYLILYSLCSFLFLSNIFSLFFTLSLFFLTFFFLCLLDPVRLWKALTETVQKEKESFKLHLSDSKWVWGYYKKSHC